MTVGEDAKRQKVTAEDVKKVLREYAEDNLPGWACASASFRIGDIGSHITESLVVQPTPPSASEYRPSPE